MYAFIKPPPPLLYMEGVMSGTSLESKAVVCWGSISVTAGCGCDSVGTISTVSYVDTYRLCTLLINLAKICTKYWTLTNIHTLLCKRGEAGFNCAPSPPPHPPLPGSYA